MANVVLFADNTTLFITKKDLCALQHKIINTMREREIHCFKQIIL
jgi:hypothetical protein